MLLHRPAAARGHTSIGWLDSRHTFSFGEYHDANWQSFRSLRVINDDIVAAGQGFGTHGHRDMEILTWVLEGALEHRDSLGRHGILRPGDIQRMSAGRGVTHSEFNQSSTAPCRFLQVWLVPHANGIVLRYDQTFVPVSERQGRWRILADGTGRDGSLELACDATMATALVSRGDRLHAALAAGRHGWLQVAKGNVTANGLALSQGDGLGLSDETQLELSADDEAEVLWFDLG